MSEMFQRVMTAIRAEQDRRRTFGNRGMTDAEAFTHVAMEEMREPTKAMAEFGDKVRGNHVDFDGGNDTANIWRAMMHEALK